MLKNKTVTKVKREIIFVKLVGVTMTKVTFSISLDDELASLIDSKRGLVPRSAIISAILKEKLNGEGYDRNEKERAAG